MSPNPTAILLTATTLLLTSTFAQDLNLDDLPTATSVLNNYDSDLSSYADSLTTLAPVPALASFDATQTLLPPSSDASDQIAAITNALAGNPVETANPALTILPSSLKGVQESAYSELGRVASSDLSRDPALKSVAPAVALGGLYSYNATATGASSGLRTAASTGGKATATSGGGAPIQSAKPKSGAGRAEVAVGVMIAGGLAVAALL